MIEYYGVISYTLTKYLKQDKNIMFVQRTDAGRLVVKQVRMLGTPYPPHELFHCYPQKEWMVLINLVVVAEV